ncbi:MULTISPECIES: hypothetical protein [Parabacteroides]|nr:MULTISPECIES: hypothetical protein [Parabacteroides]
MNIYVYMIITGVIIIGLSFVWWEDRKERKLQEGKPENDKQQTE